MTERIGKDALAMAEQMRLVRKGALLGRPETGPMEVGLIPTYACNYNCIFCALPHEAGGIKKAMPFEKAETVLRDLACAGTRQVSFTGGGDPLCYSKIDSLVGLTRDLGMDCSICTNGSLLTQERIARWAGLGVHLAVSFNAADEETYRLIHPGAHEHAFEHILQALQRYAALAANRQISKSVLSMNFVICRQNSGQIGAMADLARSVGASQVQFRSIQPRLVHAPLFPDDGSLALAREQLLELKNRIDLLSGFAIQASAQLLDVAEAPEFSCLEGFIASYIDADGIVFPCCLRSVDIENHFMGNVFEESFERIWNGNAYARFRHQSRSLDFSACDPAQNSCRHCPKARHFAYLIDEKSPGNYISLYQQALSQADGELSGPCRKGWGRLSADACHPGFESVHAPLSAKTGETFSAHLVISNQSDAVWPGMFEAPGMPVGLGYHWLDHKSRMTRFDNNPRPYLEKALGPGESIALTVLIQAPEKPGKYFLEFDLLQETVFWFSHQNGATFRHEILVL